MIGRRIPEPEARTRIAELEAIGRRRALDPVESAELEALLYRQYLRDRRRPARIARLRAQLQQLEHVGA